MLSFGDPDPEILNIVAMVVQQLEHDADIHPSDVMVIGAHARDIIHSGLGHGGPPRRTDDVDLALALSSWDDYRPIPQNYQRLGDSGIRFRIADVPVDIMPFGPELERPPGEVTPPPRKEGWTVAGFQDVHRSAQHVLLGPGRGTVRVPSPAGYTALKMRSWADRTDQHDTKDAQDLAVACSWYTSSSTVQNELYETVPGQELLVGHAWDQDLAAVALLSAHVAKILSALIRTELASDWRVSDLELLAREFASTSGVHWTADRSRRRDVLGALASALP